VPAGCPFTTGMAFARKALYRSRGGIWPNVDSAIAKMPDTRAQAKEVPDLTRIAFGSSVPGGNVSDRMEEDSMDEPAPLTSTPKANTVTAGP
jgi:hypothetical protein